MANKNIGIIKGILNTQFKDEQKIYFIQSYLLNWIDEEEMKNIIESNKEEKKMNLYDWLKEKDNDYDTYDTVYDICVTVCVPYEGLSPEWYDKFCNFILKHVDVIEETSDYECIADWNKFIENNTEIFKKITEESWSYMPDDEDFNYEWIREIDKLLTGYGSEKTYHYLMDMFTKNTKED